MITEVFLPHLKQHLAAAKFFGSLPFEWNSTKECLTMIKSPLKRFLFRLEILQHLAFFLLQLVMTIFSPYSTGKKLQALVFTGIYGTAFFLRWNWKLDGIAMELLNSCIRFEKSFFKGKSTCLMSAGKKGILPVGWLLWLKCSLPIAPISIPYNDHYYHPQLSILSFLTTGNWHLTTNCGSIGLPVRYIIIR